MLIFNIKKHIYYYMLIIKVKQDKGGIERALKELKSKVIKTRQMRELNKRKEFIKPSVEYREGINKAKYVEKKFKKEE